MGNFQHSKVTRLALAMPMLAPGALGATMNTSSKITPIAFGDKAKLANTLTAKAATLKTEVLLSALLPVVSNYACGHGTFKGLLSGSVGQGVDSRSKHRVLPAYNPNCPLQTAIAGLTGKAKQARCAAFMAARVATDQADHDSLMEEIEALVIVAMSTVPSGKPAAPKVDYKALCAKHEETIATLQAELAACRALIPATAPTTAHVTA